MVLPLPISSPASLRLGNDDNRCYQTLTLQRYVRFRYVAMSNPRRLAAAMALRTPRLPRARRETAADGSRFSEQRPHSQNVALRRVPIDPGPTVFDDSSGCQLPRMLIRVVIQPVWNVECNYPIVRQIRMLNATTFAGCVIHDILVVL